MDTARQAINGAIKSNNNATAKNADPIAANQIIQAGDYAVKTAPEQTADKSGVVRNTYVSSQLNARGNSSVSAPAPVLEAVPGLGVQLMAGKHCRGVKAPPAG